MKRLIVLVLVTSSVWGQNLHEEVSSTTKLRQEVESLSLEIETLKKDQQSEMDVYIQRFQEVMAQVLREKFRQEQIKGQIQLGQKKLEHQSKKALNKNSGAWIKEFWSNYDKSLQMANPVYAQKLRDKISKLRVDFDFNKISYEHALLQTWFVMESDLNKSQDADFVLSPLEISGSLFHVEMVRLGRSRGYFRSSDGRYGLLFYDKEWKTEFFDDSSSKSSIETLLTQFKQQQKTGTHGLPGFKL